MSVLLLVAGVPGFCVVVESPREPEFVAARVDDFVLSWVARAGGKSVQTHLQ